MQFFGILYSAVIFLTLTFWLVRSKWIKSSGISAKLIWIVASLRFVGTIFQQALYTFYYADRSAADIYRFFDDGIFLQQSAISNPIDYFKILFGIGINNEYYLTNYFDKMNTWLKPFESGFYNDNHIMIRLNSVLAWFSGGFYEVHGQVFSFLALIGMLLLIIAIVKQSKLRNRALVLFALLPSTTLWISGSLKESLLILGLGLIVFGMLRFSENSINKLKSTLFLLLGIFILLQVKIYFIIALTPVFGAFIIQKRFTLSNLKYLTFLFGMGVSAILVFQFLGLDIAENISQKQHDFISHMNETKAGSAFEISPIEPNFLDLILHTPQAIFTSLFRPINPNGFAEMLMLFENVLFLSIFGFWLKDFKKENCRINEHWKWILPLAFLILALIGLTTPVFGAIMRYRAPILILLVLVFIPKNFPTLKQSLK